MKKIRSFLTLAACVAAVAGVFAKVETAALTTFYIPSYDDAVADAEEGVIATHCTVAIDTMCPGESTVRCTLSSYVYPAGTVTHITVSKRVDGGACVLAFKAL